MTRVLHSLLRRSWTNRYLMHRALNPAAFMSVGVVGADANLGVKIIVWSDKSYAGGGSKSIIW